MPIRPIITPILSFVLAASALAEEPLAWHPLFDGQTLQGFIQKNGTATYRVEAGTIVGKTSEGSPNSFLCTEREYGDFELEFEVKVDDRLNSGVQIRSQTTESDEDRQAKKFGVVNGPQIEIETNGTAAYVYGESTGRGWLSPNARGRRHQHFKAGEWNKYRVVAQGSRIQTWLNDQPIEDLTDDAIFKTHAKGFIGLQVHGIGRGAGPYEVAWRNLRIREF